MRRRLVAAGAAAVLLLGLIVVIATAGGDSEPKTTPADDAKKADRPRRQLREAYCSARPHHSPEGASLNVRGRQFRC